MVNNLEHLSDEEAPNSAASDWDVLSGEKSIEEREYEQNERSLQDELYSTVDGRVNTISNVGQELCSIMKDADHPFSKRLEENFDDFISSKRLTGRATLEGLFAYANAMFPPAFKNEVRDIEKVEDARDLFRQSARREGTQTADKIDEIAKTFSVDGSKNDLRIASCLRNIGDDSENYAVRLAEAVISYSENPNDEDNRKKLNLVQSDHEGALTTTFFRIAETFDSSNTEIGKKMFDPTSALIGTLAVSTDEYYDGIVKYLRFKIKNSRIPLENQSEK